MSASESAHVRRPRAGIALVLVTVLISGVSNFVNFGAVQGTDVDAWLAARNAVVALMLLPVALLAGSGLRARMTRRDWARLATIGLLGGAVPFLLYFRGFQLALAEGGAAAASFGYRSLFLVAAALGVVFLKEHPSRIWMLAAGLLLAGNALLLSLTGPLWTDGTAYVLAATVMWAGEYTLSKRALRDLPSGTVALGRMGFGALFLVAYLAATGHASSFGAWTGSDWMTVFLSALLLFGFVATWYAGLKTVDLSAATALLVLAFPLTWALGAVAHGGGVALAPAVGAAVVVAGSALLLGAASVRRVWSRWMAWLRAPRADAG